MPSLELTFLGTGTSQGVPVIGCDCAVCLSEDPRDNRTRTSVLVKTPDAHFVIDTTPDFRTQCLREGVKRLDAALFTHAHTDHIMGFDDMRRFCELEDRKMPVYAAPATMEQLRNCYRYAFDEPQPWKNYLRLDPRPIQGPFELGTTTIVPVDLPHGKINTIGFVLYRRGEKLLAYFTDCASVPDAAMKAAEGAEILVLDALREAPHPTHMNFEQAFEAARLINPQRTYFIHLCHDVSHARKETELSENHFLAYDGLKIRAGGVMKKRDCLLLLVAGLCSLGVSGSALAASPEENAASTVVIYNLNVPEAKNLADFYCSARSIDEAQEIGVIAPVTEEISRTDYDTLIATPIREEMIQRGYWLVFRDVQNHPQVTASRIHYAALIRGMPLKISGSTNSYPGDNSQLQPAPFGSCNAASVDSELSVLGLFTSQISGVLNNPYCVRKGVTNSVSQIPPALLLVSRLDAPTVDAVKSMVTSGIKAEKEGLWGWGYIDLRSIDATGYTEGDQWIKAAGKVMRENGIPVLSDDLPDTFQSGFPITDAAAYFGWYSGNIDGPFSASSFRFVPGAVAAHLHSFSATTLHDPAVGWTGPLIQHGASASVGNVYEPYLVFTTDFGIMENKLLSGCNLAESYYAAQPVLSWMSILVGDPLYRPYVALNDNPESPPLSLWKDYRRIVLDHHGNVLKAAADLGARSRSTGESLYMEALGAAQYDEGALPAAGASFRDAAAVAKDPKIQFRLLLEQARVFEKRGMPERGAALLTKAAPTISDEAQRSLLLSWVARLNPIKVPPPTHKEPSLKK